MKARTLAREIEKHRALSASLAKRKERVDEQIVIMEELLSKLREHETTGTQELLHKRLREASVNPDMDSDHRLAISRSRKGDSAFRKAIAASNFTQNGLAKAVGLTQAGLTFYRQGRRIPKDKAEAIEKLTGWKASAKNWPGGISDGE